MYKVRLKIEENTPKNVGPRCKPYMELTKLLYLDTEFSFIPYPGLRLEIVPGMVWSVATLPENVLYVLREDRFDVTLAVIDRETFLYLKSVPHHFGWQLAIGEW